MVDESAGTPDGGPDAGDGGGEVTVDPDEDGDASSDERGDAGVETDDATIDDDGDAASEDRGDARVDADGVGTPGGRDVVVPLRLYKTVTVFSTLIAIVVILAGFVLLDRGTQRATASPEEVSLPVVALGLSLIVGGSAVYAFSTRFRAEGMGKPKDDTAERSDDG
jgi:hypothetical protein